MAPIVENSQEGVTSFIQKHKYLLAAAAVLSVGAAGYLVYTSQSDLGSGAKQAEEGKKSKKKKKKKSHNNANKEQAYPVGSDGLPNITESFVAGLSDAEKDKISMQLKDSGNVAFKAKDFEKATAYYSAAIQVKPDAVFYSNRSACHASMNKYDLVVEDTTKALELNPEYEKCLIRRAAAYEKLENYTDAIFDLTTLTIIGGFNNQNIEPVLERNLRQHSERLVTEQLKSRVPSLPSASSTASFLDAFVEDKQLYELELDENVKGEKFLKDAAEKLKKANFEAYEEADVLFSQAVEALAESDSTKLGLALEYRGAFKFLKHSGEEALKDLIKAYELNPRPRTIVLQGMIFADKGDLEQSIAQFDKAIALDGTIADAHYHKGQMYYLSGRMAEARANFERAKELDPSNVYPHIQLACIAYREGNIEEAKKLFEATKLKFPTSPEVPNYYGEILTDLGQDKEAIEKFDISYKLQEARKRVSVGVIPLVNKASLLSRRDQEGFDEAAKILEKACDVDPKSELARLTLAQIRLQQEKVDEAITLFEEASDLARTYEEKVQATSFAEASKMQLRVKNDPVLGPRLQNMLNAARGV